MKLTKYQKDMKSAGYDIIPFTHDEIVDHLLTVFERDRDRLLLMASADTTRRHELVFVLDYENINEKATIFGGLVFYNKKQRRFTHISYSDNNNWAVFFSVTTRVSYFSREFWKPLRKDFPFGTSIKRLTEYLQTTPTQ